MTDTASTLAVNSPLDILTVTRKVFTASHWTTGTFASLKADATADNEKGLKIVGCAVGGLRYAALAPMDHALDESWMFANFNALGGGPLSPADEEGDESAHRYLRAMEYLYQVIAPVSYSDYLDDVADDFEGNPFHSVWHRISKAEDVIVDWNDSRKYDGDLDDEERRLKVVNDEILPMFDRAIENATRDAVHPDQTQIDTSEGS